MNKSKKIFIDALKYEFGNNIFDTDFTVHITDEMLLNMFFILNIYVFNKEITEFVDIKGINYTTSLKWKGRHGLCAKRDKKDPTKIHSLATINIALRPKENLYMILGVVAHEMIHQWLAEQDNIIEKIADEINFDSVTYNYQIHGSKFISKMNEINDKFGLNIMIDYDENNKKRLSITDESQLSTITDKRAKKLFQFIKTDGYKEIEIKKNGYIIWYE